MAQSKTWTLSLDDVPARQNDLGNGLARQGRFGEAAAHYQRALALDPNFAEAHNNLGNIFKAQGKTADTIGCYERAVAIKPDFAMAHNNLGIALREQGLFEDAEACHRRALALLPDYAEAHYNLGNALQDQKKFDDAIACYRRAVEIKPDYAEAYMNLGNALRLAGMLDEATNCYRRAADIRPDYAEAHHNLGNALLEEDKFDEAVDCYQRALALKPDHAEAHMNLGNAYRSLGKLDDALACYRRAVAFRPDYAEAHANEAITLLLAGDFAAGWRKYEWRWRTRSMKPHGLAAPMWDGGTLQGKTILLHCEQGLGDSIQFIRYAPMVKAQGGRVLLSCPAALSRLFGSMAGIDQIFPDGVGLPEYDCHAPLLSLPMLFDTGLDTVPVATPYLSAAPGLAAQWAARLQPYDGMKIGLVWAGNPRIGQPNAHAIDRRRSMHLDQFAPLAGIPGLQFISLQKGAPAEQAKNPPPGLAIVDFMNDAEDFADTAALIANLDLVIGVDTSVIHLAGAMGKPVWVLSRFDGCWRWLTEGKDSPWYPTLRLFRQPERGDWQSVVENVRARLSSTRVA